MNNASLTNPAAMRSETQSLHAGVARRWWQYQRERFPLGSHGLLIAAFSTSTVSYSAILRTKDTGVLTFPGPKSVGVAFLTCLLFFIQLRIIDEFKDFDEDRRHRPYRPVPRGLVSLEDLRVVLVASVSLQLVLSLWLSPWLIVLLFGAWSYLYLSAKDFFLGKRITDRPLTNMWTHMLVMPVVDLFASGCDWGVGGFRPPAELGWFLAVSFFNGFVFEIGRKIRAPEDEEFGVATYSALWGPRAAVGAWVVALGITGSFAVIAALQIRFTTHVASWVVVMLAAACAIAWRYLRVPVRGRARMIEVMSAIWTLGLYAFLGLAPWLLAY